MMTTITKPEILDRVVLALCFWMIFLGGYFWGELHGKTDPGWRMLTRIRKWNARMQREREQQQQQASNAGSGCAV